MYMDQVKQLCLKKEEELKNVDDYEGLKKIELINNLLKMDNWIFSITLNEALNILYFLGVNKNDLKKSYLDLISYENYKKKSK